MERKAWLLRVKEGKEEEYRRVHAAVWPELIEAARQAGLRNHSCFLEGRRVIAYVEADDIDAAFRKLLATDVKKQWDQAMSSILEETDSSSFEEVFHFD
ncbi:MAG TPA: L-rhamnose mutarotase [Terriglobales bacterium]|jgi:L-rhamnose mutarotase|nr:L-rhamnose mutarotase [Terriglobia bacterium]HZU41442.1 L-rhamnose mutarotase [Terriglobales bacterium]